MSRQDVMRRLASKYIWWKTPEEAAANVDVAALVYFEGGDLDTLPAGIRQALIAAAASVRDLPRVQRIADDLCPAAAG
jgi:hypothetical protein